MNRLSLLIGATHGGLEMVSNDIAKMSSYLKSVTGGAWNDDEVMEIVDEPLVLIERILLTIKKNKPDFLLTYWSGHGGYSKRYEELLIEVTEKEAIRESNLLGLAQKQLLIFDTCNVILEDAGLESFTESLKHRITASAIDRVKARKYYEELIAASGGIQIAYSCNISEYSTADDILGSIYTNAIIKQSKAWFSRQTSKGNVTIKEATRLAENACARYSQHPKMTGPKIDQRLYYPFAIKP